MDYKTVIASSGFRQIPVAENEVLRNRWQDISFSSRSERYRYWQHMTTIRDQGDFEASTLHTDATGAGLGRVEMVADGHVAYTNGVETMVWGLSPAENDDLRGLKSNDL